MIFLRDNCVSSLVLLAVVGPFVLAEESRQPTPAMQVDFATDIQPVLANHCLKCHGPEKRESNYRLDDRLSAFSGGDFGEPAIVRGDSAASPLIRYVSGADEDIHMPPEGPPLSQNEIALLKTWIDSGAAWPDHLAVPEDSSIVTDHWAFQPVSKPKLPPMHNAWIANPIDGFILSRLREAGLEPSPRADRTTLIRRIFLDVLGLPPTHEEVEAFKQDDRPDAYARLVDAVLSRPQFGERWGQHWLDIARYGESQGFETNRERMTAYHYRDYVVSTFNSDKPYDQFVVEQLAGDAVGADLGTGFLVAGPYDIVKSPDVNLTLMQRQDELADIIQTAGTAFLGLTVGCARCHNHKFDPILQADYYALQAVFAGVKHGERMVKSDDVKILTAKIDDLQQQIDDRNRQLGKLAFRPPVQPERNVDHFSPTRAQYIRFTIVATNGGEPCIDELEVYASREPGTPGEANVALASQGAVVTASGTLQGYDIHQLKHINDGQVGNDQSWISDTTGRGWITVKLAQPTSIDRVVWGRDREGKYKDRLATRYRIEVATAEGDWRVVSGSDERVPIGINLLKAARTDTQLTPQARERIQTLILERDALQQRLAATRKRLETVSKAFVGKFGQPPKIHRLYRGDPLAPREEVAPNTLSVLGDLELTSETPEQTRRIRFARSITRPDHPLTSRVIVNRVWQHHFGRGLVATPSDFGKHGAAPSHPDLLDWLANYLITHEWSLKQVHRVILLSGCYQQSNAPRTDCMLRDADCALWWRFPPRRLEAEGIRDSMLATSGALDQRIGGHGFYALRVIRENVHHYYPKDEFGPEDWRRMLYAVKIRQERDGEFGAFDCPDGGQVIPRRSRSTTPLQALNLLNSHFSLQQAQVFATRVTRESGTGMDAQIERAFQLAMGRSPHHEERRAAKAVVRTHGLPDLCRVLFNTNEFLFIP